MTVDMTNQMNAAVGSFLNRDDPRFGGFNDVPPNFVEITEAQFWMQFSVYPFTKVGFKQVRFEGKGPYEDLHLFFYGNDEGVGYARVYEHHKPIGQGYGWCAPKLYFKFGLCEHEWVGVPEKSRMCYHVTRCTKCGRENHVDSSG